jgi:hypothetical protein
MDSYAEHEEVPSRDRKLARTSRRETYRSQGEGGARSLAIELYQSMTLSRGTRELG